MSRCVREFMESTLSSYLGICRYGMECLGPHSSLVQRISERCQELSEKEWSLGLWCGMILYENTGQTGKFTVFVSLPIH